MKIIGVLIIGCALMVVPALAQSVPNPNTCFPAGTWYGGSDYRYITTITPITGQTLQSRVTPFLTMPAPDIRLGLPCLDK